MKILVRQFLLESYYENLHILYIHILADALGSVSVLISSFFVVYFEWHISDPICSLLISILIIYSCIPVLKNSFMTLMHMSNYSTNLKNKVIQEKISNIGKIIDFKLYSLNSSYSVCEVELVIFISENLSELENNTDNEFIEIRKSKRKIIEIMKEHEINEYYIDISINKK